MNRTRIIGLEARGLTIRRHPHERQSWPRGSNSPRWALQVPSVPRTGQRLEPHAGVEPAETSLPRTAATVAMRREWSCRESHPVDLLAGQVVILMNNPAVELSGIAPERRPCRGRWRPFAQPRGAAENRTRTSSVRTTKVTFHTTPHQRPESNQAPSFWRRRCALRSLASAPRRGIGPLSIGRQPTCDTSRITRHFLSLASSPRVERGTSALGVRRPHPAGRGETGVECRSRTELPRFHRAPSLPNE